MYQREKGERVVFPEYSYRRERTSQAVFLTVSRIFDRAPALISPQGDALSTINRVIFNAYSAATA